MNQDIDFWRQNVTMDIPLLTLMAIHGYLCLALRHPESHGYSRHFVVVAVKQIGQELVRRGALTAEQLAEAQQLEAEEGSEDLK